VQHSITALTEAVSLAAELLLDDLQYLAEHNLLSADLSAGAMLLLGQVRRQIDDHAAALPKIKLAKGKPYGGPRNLHHHKLERPASAEHKLLANGKPRR
jgi:hypothetical protein